MIRLITCAMLLICISGVNGILLKYTARISEAQEQHQSKFAFDLGELERQMDEYYNVSRLPI
jgi:hypothetical protein